MARARSVLATMISVQTRHIIARGRLYVNSLFAEVSSPFLPTYWLGNYRMAKYDYEVSGRAWSHDRVLPLASGPSRAPSSSPAFPQSLQSRCGPCRQESPRQPRKEQAERVDLLTKESIANSVPASASAPSPLSRGTSLPVAILAVNRTIG